MQLPCAVCKRPVDVPDPGKDGGYFAVWCADCAPAMQAAMEKVLTPIADLLKARA